MSAVVVQSSKNWRAGYSAETGKQISIYYLYYCINFPRLGGRFRFEWLFFSVLASKMEVQNIAISNKKWLSQDRKI